METITPRPTERSRFVTTASFIPSGARAMKSSRTLSRKRMTSLTNFGCLPIYRNFQVKEERQHTAVHDYQDDPKLEVQFHYIDLKFSLLGQVSFVLLDEDHSHDHGKEYGSPVSTRAVSNLIQRNVHYNIHDFAIFRAFRSNQHIFNSAHKLSQTTTP